MGLNGNEIANPSYQEVCSGTTGHVEVFDFSFEGDAATYESLVRHFFRFHDPTTKNRQGNDVGSQYASVVFCYDDEQTKIATAVKSQLQQLIDGHQIQNYETDIVATSIRSATTFYAADESHQAYLQKHAGGYCNHRYRFQTWPYAQTKYDL
jgi:peptide-methionine (S)-S-oxide reductase